MAVQPVNLVSGVTEKDSKEQVKMKKKGAIQPERKRAQQDEAIYGHIFDAILEQKLVPGTRLSEEKLGELFGVSRTIIRRVLSRLASEQIIELRPNRGAIVACPTVGEAQQVLFARRMAEKAIVELAAGAFTAQQIQQLRDHVAQEDKLFSSGDQGAAIRMSGEFHLLLATMAGNAPLEHFMRSLVSQTSLVIALYEIRGREHCAGDEHSQLIDVLAKGDAAKAVELMNQHMDHIVAKLRLDKAPDTLDSVFGHLHN